MLNAGRNQLPVAAQAAMMGASVRVALEDLPWAGSGKLATSNADQVRLVRKIIEARELEIASPDEARDTLELAGADKLAF